MTGVRLRTATPDDLATLQRWDEQPHVVAADPNDDWGWAQALQQQPEWREQLIAEFNDRPLGFVQIIDPPREDSGYWHAYLAAHPDEAAETLRAIDLWIGDAADLGKGHGTRMMQLAIARCFADPAVVAILIDPLASNAGALRFYARHGFVVLRRWRFGEDACLVLRLRREDWQPQPA